MFFISAHTFAKDVTILKKKKFSITYSQKNDEYIVFDRGSRYTYARRNYQRLLKKHTFSMSEKELKNARKSMEKFHFLTKVSNPSDEDLLIDAFKMRDQALKVIDHEINNPCSRENLDLNFKPQYVIELTDDDLAPINQFYNNNFNEKIINKNDGFVLLRDYVDKFGVEEDQKKGGLSLTIGEGSLLQAHIEQIQSVDNATRETVEIEGTKFEIRRGENSDDIYLRVVGKQGSTSESDSYGALRDILKANNLETPNLKKDENGLKVAAEVNLGNRFNIFEDGTNEIVSDVSVGRQVNLLGEVEGYTRMRGDIRYRYIQRDEDEKEVASVEARIYYDRQMYDDLGNTSPYGIEITRKYKISDQGSFFIEGGLHKKDPIERQYNSHRKPQWDKTITVGVEYKF